MVFKMFHKTIYFAALQNLKDRYSIVSRSILPWNSQLLRINCRAGKRMDFPADVLNPVFVVLLDRRIWVAHANHVFQAPVPTKFALQ